MESAFNQVLAIMQGAPEGVRSSHALLEAKFSDIFATFSRVLASVEADDSLSREITSRFNAASPVTQRRLIVSPEVWEAIEPIKNGQVKDVIELETLLQRLLLLTSELLIAEDQYSVEDTDIVLSRAGRRFVSPFGDLVLIYDDEPKGGKWVRVPVPMMGSTVALDFDSHLAEQHLSESVVFCLPRLDWTANERVLVSEKLNCAMSNIDSAAPPLGSLIRNFVRRVFLRKSLMLDDSGQSVGELIQTSEHEPRYPGTIGLSNPHLPEVTIVMLMEIVLHESVHNLMSCYETAYGEFMEDDLEYRPVSPWSGNLIPNHALAHAAFVYYACHLLLERCLALDIFTDASAREEAERRACDLAAGFYAVEDLPSLFLTKRVVNDGLAEILRVIQALVRYSHPIGAHQVVT